MGFTLELPTEEEVKQEVEETIKPTEKEEVVIVDVAKEKADQIMGVDIENFENRKEFTDVIEQFGLDDMKACHKKNAILQQRLTNFHAVGGETGDVAKGLEELTIKMKDLDPSGIDFVKQGPLGKIFNPVRKYFERYNTADKEIATIVDSLEKGKKTLTSDNVTLEIEQSEMREMTKKMQKNIELGNKLDAYLSTAIENAKASGEDQDKIDFLENEILFPLRQRIEDFQQIQVVDQQGIIAMELIRRNNKELICSVERAQNVTVTALRTAVTVAGALYNQKIVLEKVNALNATTNHMIESTSKMLHEQGVAIQKQATEASVSPETLRAAFDETLQALDDINNYKKEALPRMKETINTFNELAVVGEKKIEELEKAGMLQK